MACVKTGAYVRYKEGTEVYPGDKYKCFQCGAEVHVCTGEHFTEKKDEIPREAIRDDLWME